jgi:hypothetical protein
LFYNSQERFLLTRSS